MFYLRLLKVTFKMLWRCVICGVCITFSLKLLLSHINRLHSRSPDFCYSVVLTDALRNIVYNSFYHHVKRNHLQHLLEGTRPDEQPSEESQVPPEQDNIQLDQLQANSSITDQQLHTSDSDEGQRDINQHGAHCYWGTAVSIITIGQPQEADGGSAKEAFRKHIRST